MANLAITDLASRDGEMPDTVGKSVDQEPTQNSQNTPDDQAVVSEVNSKYARWRSDRRPYEAQWFWNASLIRGLANTRFNPVTNVLEARRTPLHRSRDSINIILPKVKAKLAKFMKDRPLPVVLPASTDHEKILNASATTKVLTYLWDKLQLEQLYEDAILWSMQTGKAFWWFRWNTSKTAPVKSPPDVFGQQPTVDVQNMGDVEVELGTAFELLVSDPGIARIAKQPEIMRIKAVLTADLEKQFNLPPGSIPSEVKESDLFQYQRQISALGAKAITGMSVSFTGDPKEIATYSIRKELLSAPSAAYPNGRYVVVAGDKVLQNEPELPYDLAKEPNPFPVVEFTDTMVAGQFWPTTMVEQLGPIQSQRNRVRNTLDENLKLHTHPKIFVPKQANLHKDAWNSEAGEKIPFNFQPGMPYPQQWVIQPPAIAPDVWRALNIYDEEADKISVLYPASMGGQGATSGFDTNLLQEASDSVHGPDIRRNELALRDAAYIIRRIVKMGYDVPRLIAIAGRDKTPDVFEFSSDQVDEHASIIIDTGSALPSSKSARIQTILNLDERQLFGPIGDPTRNRKLTRLLQLGTDEQEATLATRSEDHARLENLMFSRGQQVQDPMPWENHDVEYEIHTDQLQAPDVSTWQPQYRQALIRHVILHVKWKNPQNALQLAAVFGMQDVTQEIQQTMMVEQQAIAPPPGTPQGPPPPTTHPSEMINYKDAPPDIRRQMEAQAGLTPSNAQEVSPNAPKPPAQPAGGPPQGPPQGGPPSPPPQGH